MAVHVINEAKRCLNCKKPMCRTGCPINTPIPDMIHAFITGGINDAGQMLFQNNPLSLVCSLVCNHENQCEGHCVLNRKGSGIHVSSIENYISDNYLDKLKPALSPRKNIRCAIIGSGPAGITIAIILATRGYDVTIFESRDQIGGVLRYGIPEFRLPKTILDRYKKLMTAMGIRIRPNTSIGAAIGVDDLFRDEYRSIFIGTGVWKPNTLGVKGESLGNVHYAIDYLSNPDAYSLGETVNVIGAGNAAMDVARTALRKGAQNVTVFSRASTVAASQHETEYAMMDGVSFEYCKAPVELTDEGAIFREGEEQVDGSVIGGLHHHLHQPGPPEPDCLHHLRHRRQRTGPHHHRRQRAHHPAGSVCLRRRGKGRQDSGRGGAVFQAGGGRHGQVHAGGRCGAGTDSAAGHSRQPGSRRPGGHGGL